VLCAFSFRCAGHGRLRVLVLAALLVALLPARVISAAEFTFDLSDIETKPYAFGGLLELRPVYYGLERSAALYNLRYYDRSDRKNLKELNARLQLDGSYEMGIARLVVRSTTDISHSRIDSNRRTTLYDGYLSLKPTHNLTIDAGKKNVLWGTGYAWNPVAFIDRPKDPDDPDLSREGYVMLSADYVKSLPGALQTVAVTPVILPAGRHVNKRFGSNSSTINIAGRLYLLYRDTDIGCMFLAGGSRGERFGFDLSKNITSNFEVHGEWACLDTYKKQYLDRSGARRTRRYNAVEYLLGMRYLTRGNTTWIVEYYKSGTGFTEDDMRSFYGFITAGLDRYERSGNDTSVSKARQAARTIYGRKNPMRDYLYVRISNKEPFDILYCTPSITGIVNLNDASFSLTPEVLYLPLTNLEFRLKAGGLFGTSRSEFGERQNSYRIELRVRYYF
jgi:hypothetical protein